MKLKLDGLARWIRHSGTGQFLASHLGALYIRLVRLTTRWTYEGFENYDVALGPGTGVIAVIWHGRLFMAATWAPRRRRTVAMISNNRDGDLITAIVRRFGILSVRGSTYDREKGRDKGGVEAYTGAQHELLDNQSFVAITPDGPRGPRMRCQKGAAMLAVETGLPVFPITYSVEKGKVMRSWDRFLVPLPFGRGIQICGEGLIPPPPGDPAALEAFRLRIEDTLTAMSQDADRRCGRVPVEPGPPIEQ